MVRVLSVSPTFHKLEMVGSTETQLEHHLLPTLSSPATLTPQPHPSLSPSAQSPGPSVPLQFFLPDHWWPVSNTGLLPLPQPHVPSLDGLKLAEGGQTLREDTQDTLLNLPTCGRERKKAPQVRRGAVVDGW